MEIKVKYSITQLKGNLDVSKFESMNKINRLYENKIAENCKKAVKKAKELKADVFGFGERIHSKDPKYWKTVKNEWNKTFETLPVRISVKAELISTGNMTKPLGLKD